MNAGRVKFTAAAAGILLVVWLFCFVWAIADYYSGSAGTARIENKVTKEVPETNGHSIAALGDSLTRGTGDESGRGYVGNVATALKKKYGEELIVQNLGIKGQRSEGLKEQVKQAQIKRQLKQADTVLMTIGGNDLFQGGETLLDLDTAGTEEIQEAFLVNLKEIFTSIRAVNSKAQIFMIGLYNPFIESESSEETSAIVREWNFQTEELCSAFPGVVFVPVYDLFQQSVKKYLYTDQFHPNKEGYRLIAERLAPLIQWEEEKQ